MNINYPGWSYLVKSSSVKYPTSSVAITNEYIYIKVYNMKPKEKLDAKKDNVCKNQYLKRTQTTLSKPKKHNWVNGTIIETRKQSDTL